MQKAEDGTKTAQLAQPSFFRLSLPDGREACTRLLREKPFIRVYDKLDSQLRELVKSLHPDKNFSGDVLQQEVNRHLNGVPPEEYGVWVYYPWSEELVHILDEDEFAALRTNRNQFKITLEEQALLATKKIGVIGLSVGQSVALTMAMERIFGELRIADFDILELSNMNRIRTGLSTLGIPKVTAVAREIATIDPYLKVVCFHQGLTEENMDQFMLENGKLDLLVEECDGLDIKILSRLRARHHKIPVIMDTSDRGMIDIERFDLEPERPILHGLVEGIDTSNIRDLSNEDKIPIILRMVGAETTSVRGKASMIEVAQTITTWPQLASSVVLGGAAVTQLSRKILLDQLHVSGRYFVDMEAFVPGKEKTALPDFKASAPPPLSWKEMKHILSELPSDSPEGTVTLPSEALRELVTAAGYAPSSGNDQPWKWLYSNKKLFLFHDRSRSYSLGDFQNIASYISFGCALENLTLKAHTLNIPLSIRLFPLSHAKENKLVAEVNFFGEATPAAQTEPVMHTDLARFIVKRCTNRNNDGKKTVSPSLLHELSAAAQTVDGAKVHWFTNENEMKAVGEIISACDRIRLLNLHGHHDFVNREMRWTPEEAEDTRDGIDIATLGMSASQMSALKVIKDPEVIRFLNKIKGGKMFESVSKKSIECASALGLITMPAYDPENFINGGRAVQRLWLSATKFNLALHPLIAPLYFFPRILYGNGEELSIPVVNQLKALRKKFLSIAPVKDGMGEIFLFRVAIAEEPEIRSLRLPIENILHVTYEQKS